MAGPQARQPLGSEPHRAPRWPRAVPAAPSVGRDGCGNGRTTARVGRFRRLGSRLGLGIPGCAMRRQCVTGAGGAHSRGANSRVRGRARRSCWSGGRCSCDRLLALEDPRPVELEPGLTAQSAGWRLRRAAPASDADTGGVRNQYRIRGCDLPPAALVVNDVGVLVAELVPAEPEVGQDLLPLLRCARPVFVPTGLARAARRRSCVPQASSPFARFRPRPFDRAGQAPRRRAPPRCGDHSAVHEREPGLVPDRVEAPDFRHVDAVLGRQPPGDVHGAGRHVQMEGRAGPAEVRPLGHRLEVVHRLSGFDLDRAHQLVTPVRGREHQIREKSGPGRS